MPGGGLIVRFRASYHFSPGRRTIRKQSRRPAPQWTLGGFRKLAVPRTLASQFPESPTNRDGCVSRASRVVDAVAAAPFDAQNAASLTVSESMCTLTRHEVSRPYGYARPLHGRSESSANKRTV